MSISSLEKLPHLTGVIKEALRCVDLLLYRFPACSAGLLIPSYQAQFRRSWRLPRVVLAGGATFQWHIPSSRDRGWYECLDDARFPEILPSYDMIC